MPFSWFKGASKIAVSPNIETVSTGESNGDIIDQTPVGHIEIPSVFHDNIDMQTKFPSSSRLSQSFEDMLGDEAALSYFFHFLEAERVDQLLKFWLEVASFRESETVARQLGDGASCTETDDTASSSASASTLCGVHCDSNPANLAVMEEKLEGLLPNSAAAIYLKYFATNCRNPVVIPEEVKYTTLCNIIENGGTIDTDTFASCQNFVGNILKNELYPDYMKSEFHVRYLMHILTRKTLTLADIIYNEDMQVLFTEFLEAESLASHLCFLLAVDSFNDSASSGELKTEDLTKDALAIHDRFLSKESPNRIGFSDSLDREILDLMCGEAGPDRSCFEKARYIVYRFLEETFLPQFTSSQLFYKHLGDLVNLIDTSQIRRINSIGANHVGGGGGSDSASERSETLSVQSEPVSVRNSLLAGADGYRCQSLRRGLSRAAPEGVRINAGMLDPDALWIRARNNSSSSSMTFGRVDEFGEFHSEIARPKVSVKPDFGAILGFKKSKTDEVAAQEVARKIIEDVQKMNAKCTNIQQ